MGTGGWGGSDIATLADLEMEKPGKLQHWNGRALTLLVFLLAAASAAALKPESAEHAASNDNPPTMYRTTSGEAAHERAAVLDARGNKINGIASPVDGAMEKASKVVRMQDLLVERATRRAAHQPESALGARKNRRSAVEGHSVHTSKIVFKT